MKHKERNFQPSAHIKCEDCGWHGRAKELEADSDDREMWSNWVCPGCGDWLRPENYLISLVSFARLMPNKLRAKRRYLAQVYRYYKIYHQLKWR